MYATVLTINDFFLPMFWFVCLYVYLLLLFFFYLFSTCFYSIIFNFLKFTFSLVL